MKFGFAKIYSMRKKFIINTANKLKKIGTSNGNGGNVKLWPVGGDSSEESKKRFIEIYGEYVGSDEHGVDQHIRQDGSLKMNTEFNPERRPKEF